MATHEEMIRVSVVIPAYSMDRWNTILETVASIQSQTYAAWEIIIAVGGDPELVSRLEEEFSGEVKVVLDPDRCGPARTRNLGLKAAKGQIIAFLEDDAAADSQWLANLVSNYRDSAVMAVGGRAIPVWEGGPPRWLPEELYWIVGCTYKGHPTIKTEIRSLPGCNMSFRREVFERLGPFNLRFGHPGNLIGAEDTELFVRLHRQIHHAKVVYEPAAIVYHHVPISRQNVSYLMRRSYGEGIGRAFLRSMYPGALSTESDLLRYLFIHSIPWRIGAILRGRHPVLHFTQTGAIALSILVTGVGFGLASIAQKVPQLAGVFQFDRSQ